uniref:Transglutaminase-like domain-containing protein n=1 Tax=Ignisphaera aggregans TaxID=334771 RepID=A0A7J2U077_9CREN
MRKRLKVLMLLLITLVLLLCVLIILIVAAYPGLTNYLSAMVILIALTSLSKTISGYSRVLRVVITAGLAVSCAYLVIMVWPELVFLFFSWIRVSSLIALMLLAVPIPVVLAVLRNRFKEVQVLAGLTLIIISVVYLLMLVLSAQLLYPMHITDLKTRYGSYCSLENVWLIAKEFSKTYFNVYGINERVGFKLFPKIGEFDLIPMELREVLSAVARIGTCGEFAMGLARLLRDSFGCETRIVAFKTLDHEFPEVKVNGTWYVFDLIYTTPDKPVEAGKYAEYLQNKCMVEPRFCKVFHAGFKGLVDTVTGEDLRREHGFSTSSYATKLCYFQLRVNS